MTGAVRPGPAHVVIIGGGFTGAAVAWHLARTRGQGGIAISVVEPRPFLGGGVAYSSEEPSHRVNVPASRMSLLPDDPEHFARWLAASGEVERDPASVWTNADIYPRRCVFGRYVEEQLAPYIQRDQIRHERALAIRVEPKGAGWSVELSTGQSITATAIVLAATHPLPGIPGALEQVSGARGFVANPYAPGALGDIGEDGAVLIVGSGLTSADMVAQLDRNGHRGQIQALSRHGLCSRGHPPRRGEPFGDFASVPATKALRLLRDVRSTVRIAKALGVSWHSVLDRLRTEAPAVWSALPTEERSKLVRRLRVFWDVHRFRIAPQVEAVLERRASEGTFATLAARLINARHEGGKFAVWVRRRGHQQIDTLQVDAIVNATGPAHRAALRDNPALRSLADAGHIRSDRLDLGIDTSRDSRALSRQGNPVATLFIAGPLARGTFGELMGLPEVVRHAAIVAFEVGSLLDVAAPGRLLVDEGL